MKSRRVVVTGIGALTPIGNNVQDYWNALQNGVSGAARITRFDASKFKTQFACEVKGFDITQFIDRKEARRMDPYTHYAMVTADEAIINSGLDLEKINKNRAAVIWASGIGGLSTFHSEVSAFARGDGTPRFSPFFIPMMIADIAAGLISIKYGFRGPNFAVVSACASSTNAICDAYAYIKLGKADIAITGGSEASVTEPAMGGFNSMKALSERNDDPASASRPYDLNRDGFVLGEGAGALVLEELDHALARGAKIYAELVGIGASADAYHMTAPHPDGLGAALVMQSAIEEAGISPFDVQYINTHGTSTPLGDPQEIKAIQKVFGEAAYQMNISSTKSMTGHLLGGAGAIEAIASIMAIELGIIPPTINHSTPDPEIDPKLNLTLNKAQKREVSYALSNTFGFGGHNASVLFSKYKG
ncbi:MAG: beta-ketoacyl-ACP synthase II [Bacteroidia bacterium]|jgi:3-oxoacyl-[acyl-carrier-protein] synthase II|nr:beta-ketoacyl-ACP synthase II [Bacteroidia bacterium]